jgi:type IV pilus assembly protein PilY1
MGGLTCVAERANAQNDINPAQPNVLLLVDTSGSMEWKSSTAGCPNNQPCYPKCVPDQPNDGINMLNEKSRWTELVEVLTGSIDKYSCYAEPRKGPAFTNEFDLGTVHPADYAYPDPYHRPLSNLCAPGPGVMPPIANPYLYPTGAIRYRPYDPSLGQVILNPANDCTFNQSRDGVLDGFDGLIRFGLMTFDTHVNPGTGVDPSGQANNQTGVDGTWSYFISGGCRNSGPSGECLGSPTNCSPYAQEVGARNAAAPPWEGRMVAFGPSNEDGTTRNQWIQEILLATRPYGATPIAGMLDDARNFLWNDDSIDPLNPPQKFGPKGDPLATGGGGACRESYIVLLTDGEPNMDLRDPNACVDPNTNDDTHCPFQTPEQITYDLANPSDPKKRVRTFVVGFAIGNVTASGNTPSPFIPDGGSTNIDCQTMDLRLCNPMPKDRQLKACCVLNEIAFNGTPVALQGKPDEIDHALFPQGPSDLRGAFEKIFLGLFKRTTGRTSPVTTPGGIQVGGGEFTAGVNISSGVWAGLLSRKRITCDQGVATVAPAPDPAQGDDFAANVNGDPLNRNLFTVVADADSIASSVRHPTYSMRPLLESTVNDGVGHYSGQLTNPLSPQDLPSNVPAPAAGYNDTTCDSATEDLTAAQCRDRLLSWAVGLPSALNSRCPKPGGLLPSDCSVLGDIFHSQVQIRSGRPAEFLRDDSYAAFATSLKDRDNALYVSSNDGFFHSFLLGPADPVANPSRVVDKKKNNELWAFIPPAVLPFYASMFPGSQAKVMSRMPVLDGTPVLKDVVATQGGSAPTAYPYRLERKSVLASSETETWRTIAIQGFGPLTAGYFALDVTQPTVVKSDATTGPKFLWQLTTDDAGNAIFGKTSPNPTVTTVFVNTGAATEPNREVPVAVLPGGEGDAPTTGTCTAGPMMNAQDHLGAALTYRPQVRCYKSSNSVRARSLTIVRLDTGQILRTFRPFGETQPVTFDASVLGDLVDIPAPIVGQPAAYPSQTGQIADRIFVGDSEGRVWRVDVSDPNPLKWTMQVFYDAYYGGTATDGQPIETPPVLSVDDKGQVTVNVSTGKQDPLTADPKNGPFTTTYIASVTETVQSTSSGTQFTAQENWRDAFTGGTRVTGPMTLFNKTLYYSTYTPAGGDATCDNLGQSVIYSRPYVDTTAPVAVPSSTSNAVVFGVGLRQLPSCNTVTPDVSSSDAFLGYGKTTTMSVTDPGKFQLVIQLGGAQTANASAPVTVSFDVSAPNTPVRIDSWAPIIE